MKKFYIIFAVAAVLMALPAVLFASSADAVITTIFGPTLEDIGLPEENLNPAGLALDRKTGDLYISNIGGHRILMRDVDTGILSLVAGTGESGFEGDNGPAVSAKLNLPRELIDDGYKTPGAHCHYPQGLLSCLYDLKKGVAYDFDLVNHMNERDCAMKHFCVLESGDVVVFDRGYFSYLMVKAAFDRMFPKKG